jgi:hypothetical protein
MSMPDEIINDSEDPDGDTIQDGEEFPEMEEEDDDE